MTPLDVLKKARALLADPERWTQRAMARRLSGDQVEATSDLACQWCALGALWPAGREDHGDAQYDAKSALILAASNGRYHAVPSVVADFNDAPATTHADVLALYDRAIAQLEAA